MSSIDEYPCAGVAGQHGCGAFEAFVVNELACLSWGNEDNPNADTLDKVKARKKLYDEFVESGFCPLKTRHDDLSRVVTAFLDDSKAQYGGCTSLLQAIRSDLN